MPFKPGQSGNPLGRPKSAISIAKHVSRETNDGAELVDRLLEISRNEKCPLRERLQATSVLLDRLAGRPLQPSEVALAIASESAITYPPRWHEMSLGERGTWLLAHRSHLLSGGLS